MGFLVRTAKDMEKLLGEHTKLIVKKIEEVKEYPEEDPGREFEVYLVEPKLPEDFKGFVQRLMMLINDMNASSVTYVAKENSIRFWYDR